MAQTSKSSPWKLLIALPLVALTAGCVAGGGSNSGSSIEETVDNVDLDGDGSVDQGGTEVGQVN